MTEFYIGYCLHCNRYSYGGKVCISYSPLFVCRKCFLPNDKSWWEEFDKLNKKKIRFAKIIYFVPPILVEKYIEIKRIIDKKICKIYKHNFTTSWENKKYCSRCKDVILF